MPPKHPTKVPREDIADHLELLADAFNNLEWKAEQLDKECDTRAKALRDMSNQVERKVLPKGQAMMTYQHYYQLWGKLRIGLYIEEDIPDIPIVGNLAEFMHKIYEEKALELGWKTQEQCQVEFEKLPEANKKTMMAVAYAVLKFVWGVL